MLNASENSILKLIRYTPIVFITLLSVLITYLFILEYENKLKKEISDIETEYINSQKTLVKTEVQRVYDYIEYKRKKSEENLKKNLKDRIYEAHSIATNIYYENKDKSKEEVLKLVKDALREIRFNDGRGYYFIHNIQGDNLLYPLDRRVEGNNYSKLKDINGYLFVQKIMDTIKHKTEIFDTYYWSKPSSNELNRIFKKIAFYKYFEPLNISIGTGEYLYEYEQGLKKHILDFISSIRYSQDGYVFIIDNKEKILAHFKKDLIGQYFPGRSIGQVVLNYAKENNHGYVKYKTSLHVKDDLEAGVDKITYVKNLEGWNWIIGSGFYTHKVDALIEKRKKELEEYKEEYLFNSLLIILIITLILLVASISFSSIIQKKFIDYRKKILEEIEENRKKDNLLSQQSKMAAMGEMIGNIAHQWRQPLSLISTTSSSLKLKEELGLLEGGDVSEASTTITSTTQHLSKTIDDFRNFFQPNKEITKTSTHIVWDKTANLIKDQYRIKNINLITNIQEKQLYILESELIQVILNILNNARDEFEKKKLAEKYIFITIKQIDSKLLIEIKDNAGGIPDNIIARVFEPYFTTKHKSQGTGIGLYMSQQIIQKHMNGSIDVLNTEYTYKNKKYKGAKFNIIIESF